MSIPLSVLDLLPIPSGSDAPAALQDALGLVQYAEALGYGRYWVAEHHNMRGLASSVPLAVLSAASQVTSSIRLGSGGVINLKVTRVGGHAEARRVHDVAQAFGAPVWCGGMLESGVGRAHNIHLSTLPNFTLPGDTSSASRYWETDVIHEPLEAVNGLMTVPTGPGTGVTLNRDFLPRVTELREEFHP